MSALDRVLLISTSLPTTMHAEMQPSVAMGTFLCPAANFDQVVIQAQRVGGNCAKIVFVPCLLPAGRENFYAASEVHRPHYDAR